ncbi:MAG TPA: hypothetical protein VFP97_08205 [Chitinophagaceae bacterium]|nr:hypothetical protein [Chitinophagaceae bacterium]
MKKVILPLLSISLYLSVYSQVPLKRTDSIVNSIESKQTLTLNTVSDTFATQGSKLLTVESVKFYSSKKKLAKVIFSGYYHQKDSTRHNIPADHDVFYFSNDVLIKVISKDFDHTPPKDLQFYLDEKHRKKYLSKETQYFSKFDGINYFIELGYNLLEEFKFLTRGK